MRITFLINSFRNIGGAETAVGAYATALADLGHDVEVLSVAFPDRPRGEPSVNVVHLARSAYLGPWRLPGLALAALRHLRARRPDVMVAHLFPASLLAASAGRLLRVPYVIAKQNLGPRRGPLARRLERWAASGAAEVHLVAGAVLGGDQGWPELRPGAIVHVQPNPVPPAPARVTVSQAVPRPYFLFLGRLVVQKDLDLLLEAWEVFTGERGTAEPCWLVVAGDGPERDRLHARAARLTRIVWTGEVDHQATAALLSGAEALVLPSRWEGLPLVVQEALALGVPVVATAVGGVPEVVDHAQNGLLIEQRDPAALASGLAACLADRDRLARGCASSVAGLSAQSCAQRLADRLAPLTARGERPLVCVVGRARAYPTLHGWFSQPADTRFLEAALSPLGVDVRYVLPVDVRSPRLAGYDAPVPAHWGVVPVRVRDRTRSPSGLRDLVAGVRAVTRSTRRGSVTVVLLPSPLTLASLAVLRLLGRRVVAYWGSDLETLLPLWIPALGRRPDVCEALARRARGWADRNLARRARPGAEPVPGPTPHGLDLLVPAPHSSGGHRGPPRVGFVGTRSHRKGFDRYVETLEQLRERGIPVVPVVAGRRSDDAKEWEARLAVLDPDDRGYVELSSEYVALLEGLDVVVAPSRNEGRARAVEEALLVGVPACVSPEAGFSAGELEGVTVLDGRDDPRAWSDGLAWVTDPGERTARRRAASAGGDRLRPVMGNAAVALSRAVRSLLEVAT